MGVITNVKHYNLKSPFVLQPFHFTLYGYNSLMECEEYYYCCVYNLKK